MDDNKNGAAPAVTTDGAAPAPASEKTPEQFKAELDAKTKELEQAQHTIIELKKKKDEAPTVVAPTPEQIAEAERVKADLAKKEKELADAHKIIGELKQTSVSKATTNTSGSASGQDISGAEAGEVTEAMLTAKDRVIMARHGLTLKDINNKK